MKKNETEKTLSLKGGKSGKLSLEYASLRKAVLNVRALNHEIRRNIVSILLKKGAVTVTTLHNTLNVEQSIASQHLAVLRRAGLVKTGREGKFVSYSVDKDRLNEINTLINNLNLAS